MLGCGSASFSLSSSSYSFMHSSSLRLVRKSNGPMLLMRQLISSAPLDSTRGRSDCSGSSDSACGRYQNSRSICWSNCCLGQQWTFRVMSLHHLPDHHHHHHHHHCDNAKKSTFFIVIVIICTGIIIITLSSVSSWPCGAHKRRLHINQAVVLYSISIWAAFNAWLHINLCCIQCMINHSYWSC